MVFGSDLTQVDPPFSTTGSAEHKRFGALSRFFALAERSGVEKFLIREGHFNIFCVYDDVDKRKRSLRGITMKKYGLLISVLAVLPCVMAAGRSSRDTGTASILGAALPENITSIEISCKMTGAGKIPPRSSFSFVQRKPIRDCPARNNSKALPTGARREFVPVTIRSRIEA